MGIFRKVHHLEAHTNLKGSLGGNMSGSKKVIGVGGSGVQSHMTVASYLV
jgi:hypothetical protein